MNTETLIKIAYELGRMQAFEDAGLSKEALSLQSLQPARQKLFQMLGGKGSGLNTPLFGTSTQALEGSAAKAVKGRMDPRVLARARASMNRLNPQRQYA